MASVFPLDQDRELLQEKREADGTIRKLFRLHNPTAREDTIDIEYVIKLPKKEGGEDNLRIVEHVVNKEGQISKLVIAGEDGTTKEYYVQSEAAMKRKAEPSKGEKEAKKSKMEEAEVVTEKNVQKMLEEVAKKEKYHASDELLLLLSKTRAEEIPLGKPAILAVERTDTIFTAFRMMIQNNVLSLVVLLVDRKFYGFIDMLDVVTWITGFLGETLLSQENLDLETLEILKTTKVHQIMQYPVTKKSPFHPFKVGSSLLSVAEELARGSHRVAIVDEKEMVVSIVTQYSLLQFLHKHLSSLKEQKKMLVSEMALSNQYVLSVRDTDSTIDAFRLIRLAKVGGVAIVDEDGYLKGNISARDVKKITSTGKFVSRLFESVETFISNDPVCVKNEDTLEYVITVLAEQRLHRVYVVDEAMRPIGVLSLTDIFAEILDK